MNLLPFPFLLTLPVPPQRPTPGGQPLTPPDATEPDWRSAYLRWRGDEEEPPTPLPEPPPPMLQALAAPAPRDEPAPDVAAPRALPAMPTPAAERVDALRQLAEPGPLARVWQVELPAAGPAWQLRVEQVQPQAPLVLELRVPPAAQPQARQQLADLDRRLREAGHDILRPRVRAAADKRQRPVDEVGP